MQRGKGPEAVLRETSKGQLLWPVAKRLSCLLSDQPRSSDAQNVVQSWTTSICIA